MKDKFTSLFAPEAGDRRDPSGVELANGIQCGPFDRAAFNEMFYRLSGMNAEIVNVITGAGIVPSATVLTQLRDAIAGMIEDAAPTIDLSGYVTTAALIVALSGGVMADTIRGSSAGGTTASFSFSALGLVSGVLAAADKSISFNGASVGAGGMDAGAMPASGDLSIYAIYNPTTATWSSLGCTYATSHGETYTGAAMPAGYTISRLISVHRTTAASQFTPFVQVGRRINIGRILINAGLNSPTWTSVGTVPTPALASSVRLEAQQTTTSSPSNIWFAPTSPGATTTLTHPGVVTSWSSNVQNDTTTVDIAVVAPGTLYHFVSQGQTWSAWLAGYTF